MAYQPKSYKKFVATAATATLVATAVAPTALADFTDVNANYKNAVTYLVDQGITKGLTETTFGVTSPIKRGDAAVMIAKALGLNTTTAPDAGFTDVNARVAGAVNAIVAAGIASGKTSTTFAPELYITRQETAKIIANAYGLTGSGTTKFADVNSNWAPFVSALEEAGIAQGLNETTFGATNDVTRGQFALFLYRAEGQPYEVAAVESLTFNDEGNQFVLKFAEALPEGADLNYVLENYEVLVNGAAITQAQKDALKLSATVSADRKTVTVSHTDLDELASTLGGTQATLSVGGKSDTHVFDTNVKVSSAEVLNATQVKVKFSEAVDKASAELATNYSVNGAALGGTPVLSADGKSVVITFSASKNNTSFTLDVANVRSADLKETIEDFKATLTVVDTAAPTVTGSALAANGNLEITFSEPLGATTPIVRVNGQPVTPNTVATGDTKVVVPAAQFSVANGATASVYVAGAKDIVGNEMAIFNGTFTRVDDQVKPTISSVTQQGENQLKVVFSEALGTNKLAPGELNLLRGATVYPSTNATLDTNDTSNRTYIVTFNSTDVYSSATTDSSSVSLLLAASAVNDGALNNNDAWSQSFTFNRDKTAPTLVSSKVAADKQTFELKFSEAINGATINAGSIVVTDSKGVRYPVNSAVLKAGTTDTVTVDLFSGATALANDTYSVQLQSGAVEDVVGNDLAATTTQLVVGSSSDTTRPTVALDITGAAPDDAPVSGVNVFVLDFSEEVTTATALNRGNYRLDGVALPSNATIYFNSTARNSVTIELPADSVNIGNALSGTAAILNVSGVQDVAGNTINATNLNVTIGDNTQAVLTSAQRVGNSVVVTFSEAISSANLDATDFIVRNASGTQTGTVSGVTTVAGNNRQAQINFDSSVVNGVPTGSITVETATTPTLNLTDLNGLVVKSGVRVSAN